MKKAKTLGVRKLSLLKSTKIIIFGFKIFPFILKKIKKSYIDDIYDYANSFNGQYKCFIKYYKKNLESSNFNLKIEQTIMSKIFITN